jgi:hypothetical protein
LRAKRRKEEKKSPKRKEGSFLLAFSSLFRNMDPDFVAFLSSRGVSEQEYMTASLADKNPLVEAFQSQKGKVNISVFLSLPLPHSPSRLSIVRLTCGVVWCGVVLTSFFLTPIIPSSLEIVHHSSHFFPSRCLL